jgi:hypothetical protein
MSACGGCKKAKAGAVGILKAVTHVGRADKATIETRRTACRDCPNAIPCPVKPEKKCLCSLCGCILVLKTSNASETCPAGKW